MEKASKKLIDAQYKRYLDSEFGNIYQAYNKPSNKKIEAYKYCENLCKRNNGSDLKVISKNIYVFTAGFVFNQDDKKMFCYITSDHDYCAEI